MRRFSWLLMSGIAALSVACAAGAGDQGAGGSGATGGATGHGGASQASTGASMSTSSTGTGFNTGSSGTGQMGVAVVYGQSKDTLYKLDPISKAVTTVGPFSGCTGVQDIALDKDSNLYGTTLTDLYTIDKTSAVCTHIATGMYPNSLSFVPAGTLDPNVEALVGYVTVKVGSKSQNQYVRIDPQTGMVSNVGPLWNESFVSSGDIVSVINGPTYLTVKAANGSGQCSAADCLVEINPQSGILKTNFGELALYKKVFGLAFWAGSVYGFDNVGDLFEVKIQGTSAITTAIPVTPGLSFWGAGSTTSAPPVPN